ncbi:uncharacterized protein MONOS_11798 [Monocercomonoides exilis]|uniref:uncharacterized protein n=1 Tax=Monocercomonoides exilis TaxID=2049356 RepID=UPI003559ED5E|nr:hypothetical protein MONOS_11798 [Monocercomonoides exilis]|eukprot:MONOS_11798.1-p1 / transcript=MONOS_11798.1 / gene=MONOS_11798 / organism=Monocercomonoides_exilis_PA203 / gene_product=unspecified product / transcript_product=unspecified product / location=Mono_scaffold00612:30968-32012(+) / protein_length=333 / sequence_SO=supercontig / SO=protein_coding / is_pseudo=false
MISEEEQKKEGKNEKLLADLCECCIMLHVGFQVSPKKVTSVGVHHLLKVVLKKEESEETQEEVERAFLALKNIAMWVKIDKELHLSEIKEIIKYHQKHRNLTHLAYQYAWEFLIHRFYSNESLEIIIVNELHFGKEAARKLEELRKNVDWTRKEDERGKETKEVLVITGWMKTIKSYFDSCKLWNEEYVELIGSVVQIYRTAKDNYEEIRYWCVFSLRNAAGNGFVPVDDLLKSGAVGCVLEDIRKPTLIDEITHHSLTFFENISRRLKEKTYNEMEEAKRKELKRKVLEKIEEEGYEEIIISLHERLNTLKRKYFYGDELSLNISDYSVNI